MTYDRAARLYDSIYESVGKDYAAEARRIHELVQQHKKSPGDALLDVACGTGLHAGCLREFYQVQGLDISDAMIAVAREKYSDITFHVGDMRDFRLERQFDVITCLFSSISYLATGDMLNEAVGSMGKHLNPGGIMLIEPWFTPDAWNIGRIHAVFVDKPDLKIARMNLSEGKENRSFFTFHYLVATPGGVEHFTEHHELTLFTHNEYINAFSVNTLDVLYDPDGICGRGLYIGKRPL